MSNVVITGNASGTGDFTIEAPNSNTDRTLTLPDETGTLDTLQRAGNVLQVVQGTFATETTSTTSTFADTGLTATITPQFTTSKILALVNISATKRTTDTYVGLRLVRDATVISNFNFELGFTNSTALNSVAGGTNYLDSPATTSATTYKVQFNSQSNSASAFICGSGSVATITLMEIAA